MDNIKKITHWIAYIYLIYLFGYASLFKVFQKESMMIGMAELGFNEIMTLFIGYTELLGAVGLVVGFWIHQIKNASAIWLFPFAVGAMIAHIAHQDYDFNNALFGCIATVTLVITDRHFKISL